MEAKKKRNMEAKKERNMEAKKKGNMEAETTATAAMKAKKKRNMEAKKKRNMEAKKKRNMKTVPQKKNMEAKKKRNMETVPKKKRQNKGSVSLLRTAIRITILVLRKGVRALYVHASLESAYRMVLDYVSWGILIVNSTMSATPTKTASA